MELNPRSLLTKKNPAQLSGLQLCRKSKEQLIHLEQGVNELKKNDTSNRQNDKKVENIEVQC